jgi:hypothetical protein
MEELRRETSLRCVEIEQRHTTPKWIKKYVKLHAAYSLAAGVAGRDIYLDLREIRLRPILDDKPLTKLYRWAVRPWLERPHPLLKKYRLGVYLMKNLAVANSPYIPENGMLLTSLQRPQLKL